MHKLNIDIRRFTSFGVIKVPFFPQNSFRSMLTPCQGFLRRVHRWPIFLAKEPDPEPPTTHLAPGSQDRRRAAMASLGRRRGKSLSSAPVPGSGPTPSSPPQPHAHPRVADAGSLHMRGRAPDAQPTIASASTSVSVVATRGVPAATSAAESSLALLRARDARHAPRHDRAYQTMSRLYGSARRASDAAVVPPVKSAVLSTASPDAPPPDPADSEQSNGGRPGKHLKPSRVAGGREPSAPHGQLQLQGPAQFPPELLPLLDGEHHTDEICTQFEVGWPVLRQWLFAAGGAREGEEGDAEYGQISIIYR